jgi:hypothetical protein
VSDLFYKVVFDVYLFIPYFIVQNSGMHNLKICYLHNMFEGYCPLNSTTAMAEKSFTALFPIEDFCIEESEH